MTDLDRSPVTYLEPLPQLAAAASDRSDSGGIGSRRAACASIPRRHAPACAARAWWSIATGPRRRTVQPGSDGSCLACSNSSRPASRPIASSRESPPGGTACAAAPAAAQARSRPHPAPAATPVASTPAAACGLAGRRPSASRAAPRSAQARNRPPRHADQSRDLPGPNTRCGQHPNGMLPGQRVRGRQARTWPPGVRICGFRPAIPWHVGAHVSAAYRRHAPQIVQPRGRPPAAERAVPAPGRTPRIGLLARHRPRHAARSVDAAGRYDPLMRPGVAVRPDASHMLRAAGAAPAGGVHVHGHTSPRPGWSPTSRTGRM